MSTLSVNPSGYSSNNSSYSSINSSYPISNSYTNSSSTSYTTITCKTGSKASSYISYLFDISSIPSGSTIDSVSCKVKGRVSSTSYISTAVVQLYNDTTAKGSSTSFRSTSTSTTYTLTCGDWTYSELQNLQLRFTATRGTNQTTRAAYMYIYGADLTIDYTISNIKYTVTVEASGPGIVTPTGSSSITQGEDFSVSIAPTNSESTITVTDNGIDVSNQLSTVGNGSELSAVIKAYSTSGSISGTYYQQAVGKGSDTTSSVTNNDYCSNSGSTAYISYTFDVSGLPSNATITNITCSVKGHCESTSNSQEVADLQLYTGTTAKGTKSSFTSTSNSIVTINGGSSWTLTELNNLSLRFTIGYYGGVVVGATLNIEYTVPGTAGTYTYTISNVSSAHTIIVVIGDPTQYFSVTTEITNGTLITPENSITVAEGTPVTFSFKGNDGYGFKKMLVNGELVTPTLNQVETTATWEVTTNYSTYQTYALTNAYDGNQSSYWWTSEAQATGKYVLITFSREVNLDSFSTYSSHSSDYPHNCNVLQVSTDGNNWRTIGNFTNTNTSSFTNINATNIKYVRIYAESSIENWLVINEITMGYTIKTEDSYTYTISSISSDTTVVILFGNNSGCFVFITGGWKEGSTIYKKISGNWIEITKDDIDRQTHYKKSW